MGTLFTIPNHFGRSPQHRLSLGSLYPKPTVEEQKGISIVELARSGVFKKLLDEAQYGFCYGDLDLVLVQERSGESWHLKILNYGPKNKSNIIDLESTPCHYGEHRWWFHCQQCNRRCLILYEHEDNFACRQCLCLGYDTQRLNYKSIEAMLFHQSKLREINPRDLLRYTFYNGKPTKRMRKFEKLSAQVNSGITLFGTRYLEE